jgi:hypothetical protein
LEGHHPSSADDSNASPHSDSTATVPIGASQSESGELDAAAGYTSGASNDVTVSQPIGNL